MPRPVCVNCKTEMNCARNGAMVLDRDGTGDPYKLWSGDMYECPDCKVQFIIGFGSQPMWASYEGEDSEFSLRKILESAKKYRLPVVDLEG